MKKCYILLLSCFLGMTTKPNVMSSVRQGSRLFHRLMSRAMSTEVPRVVPQQPRMSWDEAVNKNVMIEIPNTSLSNIWRGFKESRNVMYLMTSKKYYREAYSKASEHGLMNADIRERYEDFNRDDDFYRDEDFTKPFANIVHYLVFKGSYHNKILEKLDLAKQYGADLTLQNHYGRTPLERFYCGQRTGDADIVNFFYKNGATGGEYFWGNTANILEQLEKEQKARDLYNERFKTKNEV